MSEYRFSVIIPVYNVGRDLERCLSSLLSQNCQDCEIIVVDDGSTDYETISICQKYAEEYAQVLLIRKQNTGCLDSRITGVKIAKGDFCTFCDGDDYVTDDYFEKLREETKKKADIYIFDNYLIQRETNQQRYEESGFKKGYSDIIEFKKQIIGARNAAVWNKLYRTELLRRATENASVRINMCEDIFLNMLYLPVANCVYVSGKALYFHIVDSPTSVCARDISLYRLQEINLLYQLEEKVKNLVGITSEYFEFMETINGLYFRTVAKLVQQGEKRSDLSAAMDCTEVYYALVQCSPKTLKAKIYHNLIAKKCFKVIKLLTLVRGKGWKY